MCASYAAQFSSLRILCPSAASVQSHFELRLCHSSMQKDYPFRVCVGILLVVQAMCWFLTLLDLFNPGKPLCLTRYLIELLSGQYHHVSSAILHKGLRMRLAFLV
jgi:hypothetical protein